MIRRFIGFLTVTGLQRVGLIVAVSSIAARAGDVTVGAFGVWLSTLGLLPVLFSGNLNAAVQVAAATRPEGWPGLLYLNRYSATLTAVNSAAAGLLLGAAHAARLINWSWYESLVLILSLPLSTIGLNGFAAQRGAGRPGLSIVAAALQLIGPVAVVLLLAEQDVVSATMLGLAAASTYVCIPGIVFAAMSIAPQAVGTSGPTGGIAGPLRYSLPFIPHVLASRANGHVDKWLIIPFLGLGSAGQYFTIYYLLQLPVVLGQVISDTLFRWWLRRESQTSSHARHITVSVLLPLVYSVTAVVGVLALSLAIVPIGRFMSISISGELARAFCLLAGASVLNTSYLSVHLDVARTRRSASLAWASIAALAVNVCIAVILIPSMGMVGAAIGALCAAIAKMYLAIALTSDRRKAIWSTAAVLLCVAPLGTLLWVTLPL
jgi:O-antigen/teichoic acid export membrane protein